MYCCVGPLFMNQTYENNLKISHIYIINSYFSNYISIRKFNNIDESTFTIINHHKFLLIIFSFLLFYFLSLELGLCFTRFTCRRICGRAWRISLVWFLFWGILLFCVALGLGLRICCEWLEEIVWWLVIVTGFWLFWFWDCGMFVYHCFVHLLLLLVLV